MPQPATSPSQRTFDEKAVRKILRRLAQREAPWLHREVARRMAERLSVIRVQPRRVIEWWGHLGASEEVLTKAYPQAARIVVEPDDALLEVSRGARRMPWWSTRRWGGPSVEIVRIEQLGEHAGELLWANMGLHAEPDPTALMARWHRALAVDGFLMFSTLGPGTLAELRELYAAAGWPSPMAPLIDMHDLGDMLVHAGFADPVMDQETLTLTWPSAQLLLDELRTLGGNVDPRRMAGLRTSRWRRRLLDALAARADERGRIGMSFEIVYGHAFRPPPRPALQAETSVSLAAMRTMVRRGRTG
ncbi:MAG TPA: biotin synthase [Burkholderiaceae bacterium]|nr:biotin synthase [Burkholderiaceae bacterium]